MYKKSKNNLNYNIYLEKKLKNNKLNKKKDSFWKFIKYNKYFKIKIKEK